MQTSVLMQETRNQARLAGSLASLRDDDDFTDLATLPGLVIDLRYASVENFLGRNLYGPFNRAFLRSSAADQLRIASKRLACLYRGLALAVLDATRPLSVQKELWAFVKGTDNECYVADPAHGSIHNFGFAVDVTLVDEHGRELDMGTPFDAFDDLSQPCMEKIHARAGLLSPLQIENRRILREIMETGWFVQHPLEWWHFDALSPEMARTYPLVE